MDVTKHQEYFDPLNVRDVCHIVGCGAMGSTVAENLARLGISNFVLYDFDKVEPANVANQMFRAVDIGRLKVEALAEIILAVNPLAKIRMYPEGWTNQPLAGHVFLCADNTEVLQRLMKTNLGNPLIKAMWDFRMRLSDAQHYAAVWNRPGDAKCLIESMNFTSAEAKAETPVSACGSTLSVVTTIRAVVAAGIANFIRYYRGEKVHRVILLDHAVFALDAL